MSVRTRARMTTGLTLLLLLAFFLSACEPITPRPTSQPTPTAGEPTETPVPTRTPLPLPPPRLLERQPAAAEVLPLDAPLVLTFDQPMDQASVEAAITISPAVEGAFTWSGERSISLLPASGEWPRGQHYRLTVDTGARNIEGTPLAESVAFEFQTVGFVTVSQVMPAPDSEELDPDTTVTVVFDRPVVPLTALNRQGELPDPLTFVPPVRGKGEWLNTSIYLFRPAEGLAPATHYKARVAAGLTDTTGGLLAEDYVWEFTTIRPAVVEFWPYNKFAYVGPSDVISVTFNQPMDHASAEERFTLEADGEPVAGTFRWRGGETAIAPETMVFVPVEPLPRDATLVATVAAGALAAKGNMGTLKAETRRYATVKNPGVVSTWPQDGQTEVDPDKSVKFVFASPMQRQGFMDHLTIRPQVTHVYTYWSDYDTELVVRFPKEPATSYSVLLDATTPDLYGAPLGREVRLRFTTGDLEPYATFVTDGRLGTFSAYTETVLYAAYRNVSRLDVSLYRLSPPLFVRLNTSWRAWDTFQPAGGDLVRAWSQKVQAPRNEVGVTRLDLVDDDGQALPPGLYYVELTSPDLPKRRDRRPARYLFSKSRLNLTLKQSRSEALVWATDLSTGQPVADLPLALYYEGERLDADGETDAEGLFSRSGLDIENSWEPFFAIANQPGDEDFGIGYNAWADGISPWDFNQPSEFWGSDYQGYLYTDRPIYRPDQTVYFKGIVRADDDAHYQLPDDMDSVEVQIWDPQGKELYKETLSLNDMGTLYDELVLDEEASLGTYYLEMRAPERDMFVNTTFRVAEYKKPEFQVSVTPARDACLRGESLAVSVEATYYFGGPVANAQVHWSVLSDDYTFRYHCPQGQSCPRYSWTDFEWGSYEEGYGYYGRLVAEGEAQTDDQGRVTFEVATDLDAKAQSQIFTIEASVTDLNGQQVSNRTAAIVHGAEFYVGLAPRGYLARVGQEKEVDLLAVDWEGEPVSGTPLTVVFAEHKWYSVRRQAEDGNYYWEWTAQDTPLLTTTVTTDDEGQAVAAFAPPKAGSYRVRVIGRDRQGNETRASTYFWVWGGSEFAFWRRESNNRFDLIADQDEYQVGDVAEILIASPYSGTVQALVTIERGHIMETEVRQLEGNSEVLRLPIREEYVPDIFVSVVLVQGSEQAADGLATFKMGLIKLPISPESKELTINLTPDKDAAAGEHYGPRQTVTYDVQVTDHKGQPVEAELSLRLADLAVLALADEPGPTLMERFWRERGLGIKTSATLVVAMEPFNRELEPRAKGGGGGGEEGGLVRSRFADTAFWDPVVRTDEQGQARVTVTLPDNLTTWRMQARGIDAQTRVGRAEVDVVSTLDLLVRPILPRFFVVGDRAEIGTIVHNNTDQALEVEVNLSASGLSLTGEARQTVEVPAGDKVKVTWPVEVLPGDSVKARMWASAGDLYDGREDTLPVYRYSTPEVVATAGQLSEPGIRQEIIQLPREFDPTQGGLEVQIDGSLTAATRDALDYLEYYPYECAEQTVSRFLPNVVTWQALDEMGLARPELRQQLAQMVGQGLQRLYNQQRYDGGWGWWAADHSNPYLTAYVLHGLLEAHRAGFTVDRKVMTKAAGYLRDELPSVAQVTTHWKANRLAYQLYVLGEYATTFDRSTRGELGLAIRLFEKRHLLDNYGRATLAVALSLLEPDEPQRVQTLLGDLAGDAIVSATGTHWQEAKPDYWNMNTDIRTTAIVLWALSRLEPESDLLPNAVRWLMAARQEGHWETTQATAWSLLALVEYMRASGELAGDFSFSVYLNGEEWASGDVSSENIAQSHQLQVGIADLLVEEGNRLVIERGAPRGDQSGEGQLYYTAFLRTYLPVERVQALDRGIMVSRQYSRLEDDGPVPFVDSAQVGDVVQVKLTIIAPSDLYYVVVEDPLPAGFEGVDLSLKTTSVVGEPPELRNVSAEEEYYRYRWYGWGWWWFSHSEMRDEKVVLFAEYLPRGTYEYTYLMRASVPGEFLVLPSTAYQMYFPEVFGRSDGARFTIEPGD